MQGKDLDSSVHGEQTYDNHGVRKEDEKPKFLLINTEDTRVKQRWWEMREYKEKVEQRRSIMYFTHLEK